MPRGGFRDILRALWRRGREACNPASRRGVPPHPPVWERGAGAHGDIFGAVGVGEGAVACRSGARRWDDVFLGAGRRGRRRCGLKVYSPVSWGCEEAPTGIPPKALICLFLPCTLLVCVQLVKCVPENKQKGLQVKRRHLHARSPAPSRDCDSREGVQAHQRHPSRFRN